jgi:hypothetical protein
MNKKKKISKKAKDRIIEIFTNFEKELNRMRRNERKKRLDVYNRRKRVKKSHG